MVPLREAEPGTLAPLLWKGLGLIPEAESVGSGLETSLQGLLRLSWLRHSANWGSVPLGLNYWTLETLLQCKGVGAPVCPPPSQALCSEHSLLPPQVP